MPVSEIDDIFSGKSKPTMDSNETTSKKRKAPEEGQPSSSKTTLDASKKKKKKKDATQNPPDEKAEGSRITSTQKESKKARVVETVLDTSSKLTGKLVNVDGTNEDAKSKRSKNKTKSLMNNDKDDLKRFQDSRGSGPREYNVNSCSSCHSTFHLQDSEQKKGFSSTKKRNWVLRVVEEVRTVNLCGDSRIAEYCRQTRPCALSIANAVRPFTLNPRHIVLTINSRLLMYQIINKILALWLFQCSPSLFD